mmetsp:Transcript_133367/g.217139  ORF Transcript_133367/g.217139 Transcript_133367/m.217139 type:complete len:239 (+) Transcript_133367:328-1044(+)
MLVPDWSCALRAHGLCKPSKPTKLQAHAWSMKLLRNLLPLTTKQQLHTEQYLSHLIWCDANKIAAVIKDASDVAKLLNLLDVFQDSGWPGMELSGEVLQVDHLFGLHSFCEFLHIYFNSLLLACLLDNEGGLPPLILCRLLLFFLFLCSSLGLLLLRPISIFLSLLGVVLLLLLGGSSLPLSTQLGLLRFRLVLLLLLGVLLGILLGVAPSGISSIPLIVLIFILVFLCSATPRLLLC